MLKEINVNIFGASFFVQNMKIESAFSYDYSLARVSSTIVPNLKTADYCFPSTQGRGHLALLS